MMIWRNFVWYCGFDWNFHFDCSFNSWNFHEYNPVFVFALKRFLEEMRLFLMEQYNIIQYDIIYRLFFYKGEIKEEFFRKYQRSNMQTSEEVVQVWAQNAYKKASQKDSLCFGVLVLAVLLTNKIKIKIKKKKKLYRVVDGPSGFGIVLVNNIVISNFKRKRSRNVESNYLGIK
eukprot:TRINITY_DN6294_c0_g1_i1.p3 TRINITY_DN6294_c0_g1~~TRINITY_DN6294_c0_g1_i1.p3  ORF type:complete len:174 (+),score=10.53 TRINITY_DN6294_c0_g1_i1:105-626(+)